MTQVGTETLTLLQEHNAFNQWMYEQIAPYCQGAILEIGSGIGNISDYFIQAGAQISLSDTEPEYCEYLKEKYALTPNVNGIYSIELGKKKTEHHSHLAKYDTVFSLNVIEHIANDYQALESIYSFLKPGGKVVILVPAYQRLYNGFDKNLGHYRRYTASQIERVIKAGGFDILESFYFNAMGILGWFVSGHLLGNTQIPKGQMGMYNYLMPFNRFLDKTLQKKCGLSVICVGKK